MAFYEEGKIKYSSDDKGNVVKVDTSTGRVVNIPAGDSRMQYIPSQIGGTRGGDRTTSTAPSLQQAYEAAQSRTIDEDELWNRTMSRVPQEWLQPKPTLSPQEAQSRARGLYEPQFQMDLKDTLAAVDQDSIRRGFFGQMPAAAYKGDTAARMEASKNSQIAQLANAMVGQSEESARAQEALGLQRWQATSSALMNAINSAQSSKQNELANIMALMQLSQREKEAERPYNDLTAAQLEQQRQFELGYGLDKQQVDYATAKPYYSPNTGGSSGGSGGGSSSPPKLTESEKFSATLLGAINNMTNLMENGAPIPGDNSLGMTPIRKFDAKSAFNETLKRLRQSNTGLSHTQLKALEEQLARQFGINLGQESGTADEGWRSHL